MYLGERHCFTALRESGQAKPDVRKTIRGHLFGKAKDFADTLLDDTHSLEIWFSSFSDPGKDFSLYKLFDKSGVEIGCLKVEGY